MISILGLARMVKVQSKLCGYFSGNPGDSMVPLGLVKFLEQSSEPACKRELEHSGKKRRGPPSRPHGLVQCLSPHPPPHTVFVSTGVALEETYSSHPRLKPLSQTLSRREIRGGVLACST